MTDLGEILLTELTHYEILSAQGRERGAILYLKEHSDLETAYPGKVQQWLQTLTDKRN